MKGSNSAPALAVSGATMASTHHRGRHDVDTMKGSPDDSYVPRAMWSEAVESPMKLGNRSAEWNPNQFLREEDARLKEKERLRKYLLTEMAKQKGESAGKAGAAETARKHELMALTAEVERQQKEEAMRKQKEKDNQYAFRKGLDAQAADLAARERKNRLGELREMAEIKLRTAQQLGEEMTKGAKRKQQEFETAQQQKNEAEKKEMQRRSDRAKEVAEARRLMKDLLHQDELKLLAQEQRRRECQEKEEARMAHFGSTAGKAERDKLKAEQDRIELDRQKNDLRTDLYYARREQAREKQRQDMIRGLNEQMKFRQSRNMCDGEAQRREVAALNETARIHMENELQKSQAKRAEELKTQQYNLESIAEKQRKELAQGYRRPLATSTMLAPGFLPSHSGQDAKAHEYMKRVDAAKYLQKPLGRMDPEPSHGDASPGGSGNAILRQVRSTPPSSSAKSQFLAHNAMLMERDHRLEASKWSEGLTSKDMRAGREAARMREARAALVGNQPSRV